MTKSTDATRDLLYDLHIYTAAARDLLIFTIYIYTHTTRDLLYDLHIYTDATRDLLYDLHLLRLRNFHFTRFTFIPTQPATYFTTYIYTDATRDHTSSAPSPINVMIYDKPRWLID